MIATPERSRAAVAMAAIVALVAGLVVLLTATPAAAHNQLIEAEPSPDSELAAPPEAVELVFVEPLDPEYTTVVVNDDAQSPVELGEPVIEGGRVRVSLPALAEGAYTVAYRVVSADGHPVQGSYSFTVNAADRTPSPEPGEPAAVEPTGDEPTAERLAATGDADEGGGGGAGALVAAGAAAAGLLVAGAIYLWWRRHRRAA